MANYIFLMQFHNDSMLLPADESRLITISQIGSGLSLVSNVLIISLLCFLPVSGDGLFIIGNMCVVMAGAQLSFIGAENTSYPNPSMCKMATALLQFFFLAVHFSSFAYGAHLWTKSPIVKPNSKLQPLVVHKGRRHARYVVLIWAVPLLIVAITAIVRGDTYARGALCWLSEEDNTRLAFLVPMSVILISNLILYLLIIFTRVYLDVKKGQMKSTIVRHVAITSLTLFPTLSLSWVFGYSVTFDTMLAMKYIYVILNSAQGMFLLIFHVLPNGQIRRALCAKIKESGSSTDSDDSQGTGPFTVYSPVPDRKNENQSKETST